MRDGAARKFVAEVEHRTFSGRHAAAGGQEVLYVTERCVFRLRPDGLELIEIAPGVDLERDVLARMDFRPIVDGPLKTMDARIFRDEPMGLRAQLVEIAVRRPLQATTPAQNTLFINFERFEVHDARDDRGDRRKVARSARPWAARPCGRQLRRLRPRPRRRGRAGPSMVSEVVERWYDGVTRYTTSAFLRAKLGEALAPAQARAAHLRERGGSAGRLARLDLRQGRRCSSS